MSEEGAIVALFLVGSCEAVGAPETTLPSRCRPSNASFRSAKTSSPFGPPVSPQVVFRSGPSISGWSTRP